MKIHAVFNTSMLALAALAALAAFPAPSALGAPPVVRSIDTADYTVEIIKLAGGLEHPWGLAHLPDGRILVTERPGRLRIVQKDHSLSKPLKGVPNVYHKSQGGLMDVALDPNFAKNQLVYLSFAEPGEGGAGTAVGRGKLTETGIEGFQVIFRQTPKVSGGNHFGNRLVFSPDGFLFIALGERFKFQPAQDLSNTLGTVVRIKPDGSIPKGNPFVGKDDAEAAIYSYGHRNIESAAIDPATGNLWVAEMGPKGGDELNLIQPGKNYGWPLVSWGTHYDGKPIPKPTTQPKFEDAVVVWTPVISPSGMAFYQGDRFPKWQGKMLVGGLSGHTVVVITIDGSKAREHLRLPMPERIRDVQVSPEGYIDVVTDEKNGNLWRLQPARQQ